MSPVTTSASIGDNVILGCSPPDGHPTPVVRWIKDGEFLDLSSANKFQIVGTGNLVISSVHKSDAGWYICSARNLAGTRETNPTEIKITGKIDIKFNVNFYILHKICVFKKSFILCKVKKKTNLQLPREII